MNCVQFPVFRVNKYILESNVFLSKFIQCELKIIVIYRVN